MTGGQTWPPVIPAQGGGPLKKYKTTINGVETTLLLNDADAKAMGLKDSDEDKPAAKAKTPANKQAAAPANKAQKPAADKADG